MYFFEPYKTIDTPKRRKLLLHLIKVNNNQDLEEKEVLHLKQY